MGKIYVDVTVTLKVDFVSGIQRVTRNILTEMQGMLGDRLCLLYYEGSTFHYVAQENFASWVRGEISSPRMRELAMQGEECSLRNFVSEDVLLDLDSVWAHMTCYRPWLYRQLKSVGTRIVTYVYDVIPVEYPHFTGGQNTIDFLPYLGAILKYSDAVITSTQAVLDDLGRLAKQLGREVPAGFVSWLGSDFLAADAEAAPDAKVAEHLQGQKFLLSVGTLEPRKNQRLLLDACEEGLFARGLQLVLVGRDGWITETLRRRLLTSPYLGRELLWLQKADDATLGWLYRHAFACAMPTVAEGFCLPIVEALQHGIPVIASDIPVLREVGRDYCAYFPANDEQAFMEKVVEWLEDTSEYERMKAHIRNFEVFTWHDTAEKICGAIEP